MWDKLNGFLAFAVSGAPHGQAEGVDAKCYPASFEGTDKFLRVPENFQENSRRGKPATVHNRGWWGRGRAMDWYLAPTGSSGYNFTKVSTRSTRPNISESHSETPEH